jgi:hypothetical protein
VQHGGKADLSSESVPIESIVKQSTGYSSKEHVKQKLSIVEYERVELVGKSSNKVEIVCGEESFEPLFKPFESLYSLAFRAVAIAA